MFGHFNRTMCRSTQCFFHQGFEAPGLEGFDSGLRSATGGRHAATQFGSVHLAGNGHFCGAQRGVLSQLLATAWGSPVSRPRRSWASIAEEIRRTATGHGGDCIQLLHLVQPHGDAHGRQHAWLITLRGTDFTGGIQPLTPWRSSDGVLGMQRTMGWRRASWSLLAQVIPARWTPPLVRLQAWAQAFAHGFHACGLTASTITSTPEWLSALSAKVQYRVLR